MKSAFAFQAVSAGTTAILRGHGKALKNPNGADNGTPLRQGKSGSAVWDFGEQALPVYWAKGICLLRT